MKIIKLSHPTGVIKGKIQLDGSKSISNRVLIAKALAEKDITIKNLAHSDDTKVLNKLLGKPDEKIYDVGHAGTSFRFLTAYLATKKGKQVLTGSSRMKQRPIGPLVDALRQIGCRIEYMEKDGYPPLKIRKPEDLGENNKVRIKANISSQYLSALLLIAPSLPKGLEIELVGELVSESYLMMTLGILSEFGISYERKKNTITVPHQKYKLKNYKVESDWSASSYYYSIAALAKEAKIELKGLHPDSHQGDSAMMGLGRMLGVISDFDDKDVLTLEKGPHKAVTFNYDFVNQPDLAQTIAVICAAKGINAVKTGLKTLRIKETDRIAALDNELSKVGSGFALKETKDGKEYYEVKEGFSMDADYPPQFATYKDHRMAMAFAPLALISPILIENPDVVSKSYPNFWNDLESLGFEIQPVASE